jgi:hypothetical protein
MSQALVAGGIIVAFFALWWTTRRIGRRDREKHEQSEAIWQENTELRRVVTEMAKERHAQGANQRGKSH